MNKTVSRLLGEEEAAADPQVADTEQAPEQAPKLSYAKPSIEQLLSLWQSGNHEAVALRVLDALDAYADFLELAFRIGHSGALELGRIMDEMTSHETSPHRADSMSDRDIQAKYAQGLDQPDLIAGSQA